MCARLLECPLCSQPGFSNPDSLRVSLVRAATHPVICPVCSEILLGIDKLTIHLFGHTTSHNDRLEEVNESANLVDFTRKICAIIRNNSHNLHSWNLVSSNVDTTTMTESGKKNSMAEIFIPLQGIQIVNSLSDITNTNHKICNNADEIQNVATEIKEPNPMIISQNVFPQPNVFSKKLVRNQSDVMNPNIFNTISQSTPIDNTCQEKDQLTCQNKTVLISNNCCNDERAKIVSETFSDPNSNSTKSLSEGDILTTDSLSELVKSTQIIASPLSTFYESFDLSSSSKLDQPVLAPLKPLTKSSKILACSEKTESCNICGLYFPDRKILALHKELHKMEENDKNFLTDDLDKNFPCHLCNKVFKMRGSLMIHIRVAHSGFITNIKSRDLKLSVQQSIQKPKEQNSEQAKEIAEKSLTSELEEGYNCPTCGKFFKKIHQASAKLPDYFPAPQVLVLQEHLLTKAIYQGNSGDGTTTSTVLCFGNNNFKEWSLSEQHVIQHIKTHEGKQWECDVCTKMFTTKYFLKKHKRLHSGEMPYKCSMCDKTFTFQQSYHKHRMYHKDEKPHSCVTCGRSFKELSTLHNHERIHTGEKPFACETCGKCFRQRVSYLVHQRIHTGVMPYHCETCGRNFRYKVSQRTHKCLMFLAESIDQQGTLPLNSEKNLKESENGKHALSKKSDFENIFENQDYDDEHHIKNPKGNSWNQELKIDEECQQGIESGELYVLKKNQNFSIPSNIESFNLSEISKHQGNLTALNIVSCEKFQNQCINDHDIFPTPTSPVENETSLPSTKLKHLKLSSPVNSSENSSTNSSFLVFNSVDSFHGVDINTNDSPLQTINEDSLRELFNEF